MRTQGRVRIVAGQIGRRDGELETLSVGGRRAVALIHVAATDPLGARSYSYLITGAIVPNGGAGRVCSVTLIITGRDSVRSAGTTARVNRVVPVEVVVGRDAVPAAVFGFQRVVRPAHAGIKITDHYSLPGEAERPDLKAH